MEQSKLNLPRRDDRQTKRIVVYLERLGLSDRTIQQLFAEGLIYPDERGNAVFVNYAHTAAEIKGTAQNSRFMPTYRVAPDRFWYIGKKGETVYICASATDALALRELKGGNAIFASMAGATNYKIVERIVKSGKSVILALNNDPVCDRCRKRFPESQNLKHIRPNEKNWTQELVNRKKMND